MTVPNVPATWPAIPTNLHRPVWTVTARNAAGLALVLPVGADAGSQLVKDAGQYPRTAATIYVPEKYLNPHTPSALLMPFTTTLTITFGYTVQDITSSVVVALLRLIATTAERPGGLLQLDAVDASSVIDGAATARVITPAGTCVQAITDALAMAGIVPAPVLVNQLDAAHTAQPVPVGYSWTGSPWANVEAMADALGAECFVDAVGRFILRPVPTVGAPVYTFRTGQGGTLTGMSSVAARAPNAVTLSYDQGTGAPIYGDWSDTRPSSPANIATGYGVRRVVESRAGRPTQAAADAAAKAYGIRLAGGVRQVEYRTVPVPWLEPGDTIAVEPVDKGPLESHVVQSLTLPLDHDAMTLTTRDPAYFGPI
jgi:hypothetical protein